MDKEITLFEFYNSKQSPACFHNIFGLITGNEFKCTMNFSFWVSVEPSSFFPKDCLAGQVFTKPLKDPSTWLNRKHFNYGKNSVAA